MNEQQTSAPVEPKTINEVGLRARKMLVLLDRPIPICLYRSRNYGLLMEIKNLVKSGDLKVINTHSHNSWTDHPWDNPKSTSTYEDCIRFTLEKDEGSDDDLLSVVIFDGENLHGQPTELRVTYTVTGAWWCSPIIYSMIQGEFHTMCLHELTKREDAERTRQAYALGEDLLK